MINGYLLAEFGETALEAITPDLIDPYKERLIHEGRLSNRTIVRHLTVLHGIFKRAKRVWKLAYNPPRLTSSSARGRLHGGVRHALSARRSSCSPHAADTQDAAIYRGRVHRAPSGRTTGAPVGATWISSAACSTSAATSPRTEKMPKGKEVRQRSADARVADALARSRAASTSRATMTSCSARGRGRPVTRGRYGAATTRRSSGPACAASSSTS